MLPVGLLLLILISGLFSQPASAQVGNFTERIQQLREKTWITLNPVPSVVTVGQQVTFSGKLNFERSNPHGWIVYIKAQGSRTLDGFINPDHLLATAWVDSDGSYSVNWRVVKVTSDSTLRIYAKFQGGDRFFSSSTCGPNCSGVTQMNIVPSQIPPSTVSNTTSSTKPITPPTTPQQLTQQPPPTRLTDPNTLVMGPYLQLFYSLNFEKNPLVAISVDPDSHNKLQQFIPLVEEGIHYWTDELSSKYPKGNWNIDVEVIQSGQPYSETKPDVMINLVAPETQEGCIDTFSGVTFIYNTSKLIQADVCGYVGSGSQEHENPGIPFTATHEFIHAMGIGHAFNMQGDLMCSIDLTTKIPTCGNQIFANFVKPSNFDLAAVVSAYGFDGFENPNSYFSYYSKFTFNNFLALDPTDAIMTESTPSQNPANNSVSNNAPSVSQKGGGSLPSTIPVDGTNFSITYTVTNGKVLGIKADPQSKSLNVSIQTTGDGKLTITMPRTLIDTKKSDGSDDQFYVITDGQETQFNEAGKTTTDRTLTIPFTDGSKQIEIIGNFVIPEFGQTTFLVLVISIVGFIAVSRIKNIKQI